MMLLCILKDALPSKPEGLPSPLGMELEEESTGWRNAPAGSAWRTCARHGGLCRNWLLRVLVHPETLWPGYSLTPPAGRAGVHPQRIPLPCQPCPHLSCSGARLSSKGAPFPASCCCRFHIWILFSTRA